MRTASGSSRLRSAACLNAGNKPRLRSPSSNISLTQTLHATGTSRSARKSVGRLYTTFTWSSP